MNLKNERTDLNLINTSSDLAIGLARIATQIRQKILNIYPLESSNDPLHSIFSYFKFINSNDLTLEDFADLYAQTLTYGLFALKKVKTSVFVPKHGLGVIPKSFPFFQEYWEKLISPIDKKNSKNYFKELNIENLLHFLDNIDPIEIFDNTKRNNEFRDYIIHFYEEFLNQYNPRMKIRCGVFYTPDVLVSFIIRSINIFLQSEFNCKAGFIVENERSNKAEKDFLIKILDPAVGTGTFLVQFIDEVHKLFVEKNRYLAKEALQQKWNDYVRSKLLKQIYGFELLLTPYTIFHLKLILKLRETGYNFRDNDHIGVFLTNTLIGAHGLDLHLDGSQVKSELFEKMQAQVNKAKFQQPFTIIMGNPPYSGHSATESKWIDDLLHGRKVDNTRLSNYFEANGQPLGEKNPKWINDDYVKFIRFAQWRIEKTGYGIVAFITNHSFLDNPTFRGMRQQLLEAFTDLFILDLHGNTRRKEKSPDNKKDENVFDIQQGVCISFFIKNPKKKGKTSVFRSDLWGSRNRKYNFLKTNDVSTIQWNKLSPNRPWYMFYPLNMERWDEYKAGWPIPNIFPIHSVGIMTGQDKLTIKKSFDEIHKVIEDFIFLSETEMRMKHNFPKDKRQWSYIKAKNDLKTIGLSNDLNNEELNKKIKEMIVPILYRPFDQRFTFYTGNSRGYHERPRANVMKHMLQGNNLGLIVSRNSRPAPWRDVQITSDIIELGVMATRPGNNAPLFPLFLYNETVSGVKRSVNFSKEFKKFIEEYYSQVNELEPIKIFYYIYALLHSPKYRKRYENFLKIDFPRILFTKNFELFYELAEIGKKLANLHLFKLNLLKINIIKMHTNSSYESKTIKNPRYTSDKRLLINSNIYLEGVSKEVYNYHIGSYKVCQKWLKEKKGVNYGKSIHDKFMILITIIDQTLSLMKDIDRLISKYGNWTIVFTMDN